MRHKLMPVMTEQDRSRPISGWVELDDAYLGSERSRGRRGHGVKGKGYHSDDLKRPEAAKLVHVPFVGANQ